MTTLLSSRLTFFLKFVFPAVWGGVWSYATALLFTDPSRINWESPPFWVKWLFLGFLVLGGVVFRRVCYSLKRVILEDGQLRISNFFREIYVPVTDVQKASFDENAEVDESVGIGVGPVGGSVSRRRALVALEFKNPTPFGRTIEFLPLSDEAMSTLRSRLGSKFVEMEPISREPEQADDLAAELRGRGTV